MDKASDLRGQFADGIEVIMIHFGHFNITFIVNFYLKGGC